MGRWIAVFVVVAGMLQTGPVAAATTWYVSAEAAPDGDGSSDAPFDSLADVEAASGPGDTIVVLPAEGTLDGGITLKPGQRLLGDGPPVIGSDADALPRITNATGDGITLADGAEVSNLAISGTHRGGIYGLDVTDVDVHGNDISGHNTSCTPGFQILPLVAPTNVPWVGVPFGFDLPVVGERYILDINNGWAAIMIDAGHAAGHVAIRGNLVHDADCGDGIDIRLRGTADITADVRDNVVTDLRQGSFEAQPGSVGVDAINALGFQTDDYSRLEVDAVGNTQTYIGSEGSDCEGIFASLSGSSTLIANIDRNTFAHGIGGTSCNGMEMISGNGDPVAEMRISNSSFSDDPGDMMEAGNLGVGSKMLLELDNVVVRDTTIRGGNGGAIPFNIGECVLVGNSGAGNVMNLKIRNSLITGCNNGVSAASAAAAGNGIGPDGSLSVDISDSAITGNAFYNLWVQSATLLRNLAVRVEDTDLSDAGDVAVAIDQRPTGATLQAAVDLGGGALGSAGRNCIFGGTRYDAGTMGYTVAARGNWWGAPGGPGPDRTSVTPPVLASLDTGAPLGSAPPACG